MLARAGSVPAGAVDQIFCDVPLQFKSVVAPVPPWAGSCQAGERDRQGSLRALLSWGAGTWCVGSQEEPSWSAKQNFLIDAGRNGSQQRTLR